MLGIYAQVMEACDADRERLQALVQGAYLALSGTTPVLEAVA